MMATKISSIMNAGFTERGTVTGVPGDALMEDLPLFGLSFEGTQLKAFAEESVSGVKPLSQLCFFKGTNIQLGLLRETHSNTLKDKL